MEDNKKAPVTIEEARADFKKNVEDLKETRKYIRQAYIECIIALVINLAALILNIFQIINC